MAEHAMERKVINKPLVHRWLIVVVLALIASLQVTSSASAEVTHKVLYSFPTEAQSPEVGGVDDQGNVYVYDEAQDNVYRYDGETGAPVPFSALGTNKIDGEGGFNCPAVPTDCDRVPLGDLYGTPYGNWSLLAVDQSGGPANGYIYVANGLGSLNGGDHVEVFDPTGKYLGQIDNSIAYPSRCVNCSIGGVTVAGNGHVFIGLPNALMNQYAPIDGNPLNDVFVGQIHGDGFYKTAGGTNYSYAHAGSETVPGRWRKYSNDAFLTPANGFTSEWIGFPGNNSLWGEGENIEEGTVIVDPVSEDVYLFDGGPFIEQWDSSNHKIGPDFLCCENYSQPHVAGFDHSDGPTDGYIYLKGDDGVVALSGLVPIPDIEYEPATVDHDSAMVRATLNLAGGPQVDECQVEYGSEANQYGDPIYQHSVPCNEPTPYTSDGTEVSAELPNLALEITYYYRFVAKTDNGTSQGAMREARPAAVLGLTTGEATNVTPTSATLHGELNADGLPTTYHFEYSLDTEYDLRTPDMAANLSSVQESIEPASLTQLQPGRRYHYRIVAANSLGRTTGADRTFVAAKRPDIGGVRASDMTSTSAVIHATIDPFGYDTEYQFEFGTTPNYGEITPAIPATIAASSGAQSVNAKLNDLQPGVTYHFRVTAINEWGISHSSDTTFSFSPPSCPNAQVRQQTDASYLPDCRAYELVSPGNAGAVVLMPSEITQDMGRIGNAYRFDLDPELSMRSPNTGLAIGPSRFAYFGSLGSLDGTDAQNSWLDMYMATRTAQGWITTFPGVAGQRALITTRPECDLTLRTCITYRARAPLIQTGKNENAPYVTDLSGQSRGRLPTNLGVIPDGNLFVGDDQPSADFLHYVFSSRDLAFAPGGLENAPGSVYDNDVAEEAISIVSKLPSGVDIVQLGGNAEEFTKIPAVSRDGSHIMMSVKASDGPKALYMRVNDAITYEVSRGTGVTYIAMTTSGSMVLFASNNQLTPDDNDTGADIYMWSEEGDSLIRVSQGNGAGDTDDCNATWAPLCAAAPIAPERGLTRFGEPDLDDFIASTSGDVYFYSPEQLDADNPGVPNQRNLYRFHGGEVQYVTTFDPGTQIDRMQISASGDHIAFITDSKLTGYDNEGFDQMYTYQPETGDINCASCNPGGDPPSADVTGSQGGPFMSDDGRAFFNTRDALVPQDTNELIDVYEYVDGRPQLISAGTGERDLFVGGVALFNAHNTGLEGVSADGIDVYFSTFDSLVPEDENGNFVKFYNARTGGGFPFDPGLQPCTAADECHGVGGATPDALQIGTGGDLGTGGNVVRSNGRKKAAAKQKQRKAKHRRRAHRARQRGGERRDG